MENGKNLYIISFGTSSKYRYYAEHEDPRAADAATAIREYLEKRFPGVRNLGFLSHADVTRVDSKDESEYMSYPVLDETTLKDLESHIGNEAKNKEDTAMLNKNARYDDLNPSALELCKKYDK